MKYILTFIDECNEPRGVTGKAAIFLEMPTCAGCDNTYREIVRLLIDDRETKDLLVNHNLLKWNITCPKGELKEKKLIFRCDRRRTVTKKKKRVVERCNFYQSVVRVRGSQSPK